MERGEKNNWIGSGYIMMSSGCISQVMNRILYHYILKNENEMKEVANSPLIKCNKKQANITDFK